MNIYQKTNNKLAGLMKLSALMCTVAMLALSCSKDKSEPSPDPEAAVVAVFHGAVPTDSVNIFYDAKKISKKLLGLGDSLEYATLRAGSYEVEVKSKDGTSVLKKAITTQKDKAYSLFLTTPKDKTVPEFLQTADDLAKPADGKLKVRFVHLSPDGAKLKVLLGDTTELFKDRDYKTATDFKEIAAAKKTLKIIDQSDNRVLGTISDLDLKAGKIYTIWLEGYVTTQIPAQRLEAHVYLNK